MIGKIEILFVILFLLVSFYLVISLGAKSGKKASENQKISRYLFGVRVLIIIIAIVSLILWSFM
tara:strand:- start:188 stop:379 length:192 start_codon:yes stop_codon:yes gene_type:complete